MSAFGKTQERGPKDKFGMVPKTLLESGVDPHCLYLFAYLDCRQGKKGRPARGVREIATKIGWQERTVRTHARHLHEMGLIEFDHSDGPASKKAVLTVLHNPARNWYREGVEMPEVPERYRNESTWEERSVGKLPAARRTETPTPTAPAPSVFDTPTRDHTRFDDVAVPYSDDDVPPDDYLDDQVHGAHDAPDLEGRAAPRFEQAALENQEARPAFDASRSLSRRSERSGGGGLVESGRPTCGTCRTALGTSYVWLTSGAERAICPSCLSDAIEQGCVVNHQPLAGHGWESYPEDPF